MTGPSARNRPTDIAGARPGAAVEVRSRFDGAWCHGFEVAEVTGAGDEVAFRIRRQSDGAVLPALFAPRDVAVIR